MLEEIDLKHVQRIVVDKIRGIIWITGNPVDKEDNAHNCDQMGCSSYEHKVYYIRMFKSSIDGGIRTKPLVSNMPISKKSDKMTKEELDNKLKECRTLDTPMAEILMNTRLILNWIQKQYGD